jgi:hypothetical protein
MTITRVLAGVAVLAIAIGAGMVMAGSRSFTPYLVILLVAAPLLALAAGIATGGVRFVRSGEREVPAPQEDERGLFVVPAFRPYLALRNSASAALGVFAVVGGVALVDYFGRARRPEGTAVLVLLAWLCLLARLLWAVAKRTWVARRLGEARLAIQPSYPEAGRMLRVLYEQPVGADLHVRAVDLTLIAERTTIRRRAGRLRSRTERVVRQRLRVPIDGRAWPGTGIRVEGGFDVSPDGVAKGGFLSWRIEARTRLLGPDYETRFPIGGPD